MKGTSKRAPAKRGDRKKRAARKRNVQHGKRDHSHITDDQIALLNMLVARHQPASATPPTDAMHYEHG